MSNPAAQNSTAADTRDRLRASVAGEVATHAPTGPRLSASPSQKCDRREPLGEGIAAQHEHRRPEQHRRPGIGKREPEPRSSPGTAPTSPAENPRRPPAQPPRDHGRARHPRIASVDANIVDAIGRHRHRPGRDHARDDQREDQPVRAVPAQSPGPARCELLAAARNIAISANGRANTVWANLTFSSNRPASLIGDRSVTAGSPGGA